MKRRIVSLVFTFLFMIEYFTAILINYRATLQMNTFAIVFLTGVAFIFAFLLMEFLACKNVLKDSQPVNGINNFFVHKAIRIIAKIIGIFNIVYFLFFNATLIYSLIYAV